MIKKRGRSMVAERGPFHLPSSARLGNHVDELLETTEKIRGLTAILKSLPLPDEKREEYEGCSTQP
jgi:hypothetical protein